jgi:Fur family ferric uptake transcriptional regulator
MRKVIKQHTDSSNILEYHENKLKELGYRFTKSRRIILRALSEGSKLLDADSIYMLVKRYDPKIGIATVYRTLELLTRLNLICRVFFGSEKSYYMLSL